MRLPCCAFLVLASAGPASASTSTEGPVWQLTPDQPIERTLAAGDAHQYELELKRAWFLRLAVDQRGIDVVLTLSDLGGRELLVVDGPTGMYGTETLCFVAERSGRYRVMVSSYAREVGPGSYEARIANLRPAAEGDRTRARASLAISRGTLLRRVSSADSRRRSLQAFREAAQLWHKVGETREEASATLEIAAQLRRQGDVRGATDASYASLVLARAAGDRQLEAKILVSLGYGKALGGEAGGALPLVDSAFSLASAVKDMQTEADSLTAKGLALFNLGRYQEALDCDRRALGIAELNGDRQAQGWASLGMGNAYSALGETHQAMRAFDAACNLFRKSEERVGLTYALQGAGFLAWQVGGYRKALSLHEESLSIAMATGDRAGEAFARNNIGLAQLTLGELEPARRELERAIALWKETGGVRGQGLSLNNLGKVYELEGEREKSLTLYEQALAAFRESSDRSGEARVLASLAHADAERGRVDAALARIDESLAIFDAIARQAATPSLRGSFLALRQNAYAIAVEMLAQLEAERPGQGFARKSFQASERARARALLESLTEARLDLARELPEDLRAREAELSGRLIRLQKELAVAPDRKAAEDKLASGEEEWERLIAEMRRRSPRYASVRYPEPVSFEMVRPSLDPATALVSYSITPNHVFVFVLTSRGLEVLQPAVSPDVLKERVENYVGLISRDDRDRWSELAARLYADLVAPWRKRLPKGIRRLVVVADGALHSLPFEALAASGSPARSLVDDFVISYSPSATIFTQLARVAEPVRSRGSALLVVASPAVPRGLSQAGGALDGENFDLAPLSFAVVEARKVSRYGGRGSESLTGTTASERRFKQGDIERFRVLHFATHALLDPQIPTRSALLLASGEARSDEGLLTAREIYRLKLDSDLVVLSACQTARGRILPGEGVQGLAQAFIHAGAQSVVASLWDVKDRRTADFMAAFYRHLSRGQPKADALRAAKLDLIRREPRLAPRYWAPFVLIGEPDGKLPLTRRKDLEDLVLLAAGLVVASLFVFVVARARNQRRAKV